MEQATNVTKTLLGLLQAFSLFLYLGAVHKDQEALFSLGTLLCSPAAAHGSTYNVFEWAECGWNESSLGV